MFRIAAAAACLAVALSVGKSEHVLERARLLGTCERVATPAGNWGEWWACRAGRLSGHADLSTRSCERIGTAFGREYWRCPASLTQSEARI